MELLWRIEPRSEPVTIAVERFVERSGPETHLQDVFLEEGDSRRHAGAVVHHDARFAGGPDDACDFTDDFGGARGVMNHAPGPDEVESTVAERHLLGVGLDDMAFKALEH